MHSTPFPKTASLCLPQRTASLKAFCYLLWGCIWDKSLLFLKRKETKAQSHSYCSLNQASPAHQPILQAKETEQEEHGDFLLQFGDPALWPRGLRCAL